MSPIKIGAVIGLTLGGEPKDCLQVHALRIFFCKNLASFNLLLHRNLQEQWLAISNIVLNEALQFF